MIDEAENLVLHVLQFIVVSQYESSHISTKHLLVDLLGSSLICIMVF